MLDAKQGSPRVLLLLWYNVMLSDVERCSKHDVPPYRLPAGRKLGCKKEGQWPAAHRVNRVGRAEM